jgi:hypothetical protein
MTWSRNSVASGVGNFVAELDRNCLERKRMEHRMIALYVRRDTLAAQALETKLFKDPSVAKTLACRPVGWGRYVS